MEQYFVSMLSELEALSPLTIAFKQQLRLRFKVRKIPATQHYLNVDDQQQKLWFLAQGYAREFYLTPSGIEHTSWFWKTGDFVFNSSFFSKGNSEVIIEFYQGAIILEIERCGLIELADEFAEVLRVADQLRVLNERQRRQHALDLTSQNRLEHLKKLFLSHKGLLTLARQRDLASFLGIRDKSLHRYLKKL